MAKAKDELAKWWKEDADRINQICETANKEGMVVKVGADEPPKLDSDGSLKEDDSKK